MSTYVSMQGTVGANEIGIEIPATNSTGKGKTPSNEVPPQPPLSNPLFGNKQENVEVAREKFIIDPNDGNSSYVITLYPDRIAIGTNAKKVENPTVLAMQLIVTMNKVRGADREKQIEYLESVQASGQDYLNEAIKNAKIALKRNAHESAEKIVRGTIAPSEQEMLNSKYPYDNISPYNVKLYKNPSSISFVARVEEEEDFVILDVSKEIVTALDGTKMHSTDQKIRYLEECLSQEKVGSTKRKAIEGAIELLKQPHGASGGATHLYNGKRYRVRIGKRGGKYIVVGKEKRKVYV